MSQIPETLAAAAVRFQRAAAQIVRAHGARPAARADAASPTQLAAAVDQFLAVAARLDRTEGETGPVRADDVSQLGDYGITVLMDLAAWGRELGLEEAARDLETTTLSAADWVMRHEGEIRTLEPIVNALAVLANKATDPPALARLARFMGRVLAAAAAPIRQDLEQTNPGRPWRVLHLNRGIVATRSHDPALMEQVFDELVQALPADAPQFFREGMRQMELLDYPAPVRAIVQRYFDTWTLHTLH